MGRPLARTTNTPQPHILPSTSRNWWQEWLEFWRLVKLFIRKTALPSPPAYVTLWQQSIAGKHRNTVCLFCTMVTFSRQQQSTFFWKRKKRTRKSFPICWQKLPLMANIAKPIVEKVNQIEIPRRNTFDLGSTLYQIFPLVKAYFSIRG